MILITPITTKTGHMHLEPKFNSDGQNKGWGVVDEPLPPTHKSDWVESYIPLWSEIYKRDL